MSAWSLKQVCTKYWKCAERNQNRHNTYTILRGDDSVTLQECYKAIGGDYEGVVSRLTSAKLADYLRNGVWKHDFEIKHTLSHGTIPLKESHANSFKTAF
uniref:Uncharacterized protein n=1 Tax=uncultured Bacillota bacterium TaxID=344338 RepID=A0A650EPS1_9FIRM|nr:hypothetical protein Firmicute1046_3340 [uncultured Firmicutes bacterium]